MDSPEGFLYRTAMNGYRNLRLFEPQLPSGEVICSPCGCVCVASVV
jgi:hypothetical protein